jgi:hypothetical protein
MYLYLFNKVKIKPYVILIVRVVDEKEYSFITENITNLSEILLDDEVIDKSDLLILSLIKEYTKKIENLIQPFTNTYEDKIESFSNDIIIDILKNSNCNIIYSLEGTIIKKQLCNNNMEFLVDKYL